MEYIYYNGDIVTMEKELYAEAVYIKDGIIAGVGTKKEMELISNGKADFINLAGKTLLPAFIDAHSHFSACATSLLQVPLEETVTFEEIKERIQAFIIENKIEAGCWILAKGYDQNHLKEKCHPKKELLDEAAPQNPVVIQHVSGHMGVFNSKALELLQITIDTKEVEGGKIEKKDGELTGYLEETAFVETLQKVPMNSIKDMLNAFLTAQDRYASYGITTIQEGMLPEALIEIYQYFIANKQLKLDVVGYADMRCSDIVFETLKEHCGQYKEHFKLGGYKIFLDGSPQARTAWMLEPYQLSEDGYCGYPTLSDETLYQYVKKAFQEKRQILAHCNGDAAAAQYIKAIEKVEEEFVQKEQFLQKKDSQKKDSQKKEELLQMEVQISEQIRPVMIHAQFLQRKQLPLVKKCNIIPSFFIAHIYYWGDIHIESFGLERASYISPANSAKKEGICYTFHQDAPVIAPNMLETIWCAVTRRTKNGVLLAEEEKISVLDALKAVTINAAYQYFEEERKGSIRTGKCADFVILDKNPLKEELEEIRNIKVLETLKDGITIFKIK